MFTVHFCPPMLVGTGWRLITTKYAFGIVVDDENVRRDRRLTFVGRLTLAKVSSANQRGLGNLLFARSDARQARAF
jgi:hypothetical protein